ncbi:uncharacterized protein LOC143177334 [Calliopsis andreniformis]|uniref:uncharacterized protein LOC143177334 n=1 Tax=Calliopsis andreniformis TaxID=337506 RepID=UPI003FCE54CD
MMHSKVIYTRVKRWVTLGQLPVKLQLERRSKRRAHKCICDSAAAPYRVRLAASLFNFSDKALKMFVPCIPCLNCVFPRWKSVSPEPTTVFGLSFKLYIYVVHNGRVKGIMRLDVSPVKNVSQECTASYKYAF